MKKLVLTGAAGRLGSYLREPLAQLAQVLVSSDIVADIGPLYPNERYVCADLEHFDAIHTLLDGADMVVMAPTELLELDRDGLERLERERPDVAVALLLTLGRMQGHYLRQTAEEIQRMANW